jgi:hypothetical protein
MTQNCKASPGTDCKASRGTGHVVPTLGSAENMDCNAERIALYSGFGEASASRSEVPQSWKTANSGPPAKKAEQSISRHEKLIIKAAEREKTSIANDIRKAKVRLEAIRRVQNVRSGQ